MLCIYLKGTHGFRSVCSKGSGSFTDSNCMGSGIKVGVFNGRDRVKMVFSLETHATVFQATMFRILTAALVCADGLGEAAR